jgi:hypothetical protein
VELSKGNAVANKTTLTIGRFGLLYSASSVESGFHFLETIPSNMRHSHNLITFKKQTPKCLWKELLLELI